MSKPEIAECGPKLRQRLLEVNPVLSPDQLDILFEEYADFYPERTGLLWSRDNQIVSLPHNKILLLISGPAAGGKHELIKSLKHLLPDQTANLVTTTTRPARDNEREGIDHYFYTLEQFRQEEKAGNFIEISPQGDRFYGTPKKSIDAALKRSEPIIVSDVEMSSGWPSVEKYVATLPVSLIKVVVLPACLAQDYFGSWLPKHRPGAELNYRSLRAAWEIAQAPKKARFIITNKIRDGIGVVDTQAQVLASKLQLI